jgi:hypothetical protein
MVENVRRRYRWPRHYLNEAPEAKKVLLLVKDREESNFWKLRRILREAKNIGGKKGRQDANVNWRRNRGATY